MCLITKNEGFITDKDIIVFKAVKNGFGGYYPILFCSSDIIYKIGERYDTTIEESYDWSVYDRTATEAIDQSVPNWDRGEPIQGYKSLGQGFHSAATKDRLGSPNWHHERGGAILQCTIPTGSMVYGDDSGLLISSSIIINRRIV